MHKCFILEISKASIKVVVEDNLDSLNSKVAFGALWTISSRFIVKGLGFVSTIILARILFPEDFGIIAMAMLVVSFVEIFSSFSFDINIIQKDNVTDEVLNSAWTCKIISALVVTITLLVATTFVPNFFNEERLFYPLLVLSFFPLIRSFQNIGFVLYRKEVDLKYEFYLEVYAKVISFVLTISMAFYLKSYWALIIGIYVNELVRLLLSYKLHSYRPSYDLSEAKNLFAFSKWLVANNLLIFANSNSVKIAVGATLPTSDLGKYELANEIANLPTTEILFPISRSLFPAYSKLKHNKEELKALYLKTTTIIMLVISPICLGLFSTAQQVVPVLLGDKWVEMVPLLALLSLYSLLRGAVQNSGSIFVALGKPSIPTKTSLFRFIITLPLIFFLIPQYGLLGAAYTLIIIQGVMSIIVFFLLSKLINLRFTDLLFSVVLPVVYACMMSFGLNFIEPWLLDELGSLPIVLIAVKVMTGAVLFLALIKLHGLVFKTSYMKISQIIGVFKSV